MKKILLLLFIVAMHLSFCSTMDAQTIQDKFAVLTYMNRAMKFNKALPQEKVYLHFDNTGYFKGETMWFKAYVVRADGAGPTDMSKVVYVELVNPTGDIVKTCKLAVKDGVANGDIKLDSIFGSGFYEVRAYTRYMTNWGNGGIFSRVFPVFEKPVKEGDYSKMVIKDFGHKRRLPVIRSNDESVTEVKDRKLCVKFYPEGGHFVKGLPSRVAFFVSDKNGEHQNLGGQLLDENKQGLLAVNSFREGRGVFEFTPDGKPKYLRIADKKGNQHDFLLPTPVDEGLTMNLNMLKDDEVTATIHASESMQGKLLGYTMIHNGQIIQADTLTCEKAFMIPFDRATLPEGVSQLTFFTSDGHIQAERQFFIFPKSKMEDTIRVTSPNAFPKPCGKVVLNVKAQPNSSISLSAMDAATMTNGREGNAITWLLLSSDVKGYISDPGYYFEADDRAHRMAADLLMMVQGWKRYDWALMANAIEQNQGATSFTKETAEFKQYIEDKLYLYGQLKQRSKKYPVDNVWLETTLYNSKGYSLKGTAKTDSLGNYAFSLPDVDGDWKMVINTGVEDKKGYWKDVNFIVGIDRHFSPNRRLLLPEETKTIDLLAANLFNDAKSKKAAQDDNVYIPIQKRDHVLPTVIVKAKRRIYDGARAAWESEDRGRHFASLYYNADLDVDKFEDLGITVPTLYSWLSMRNPLFNKDVSLTLSESTAADDVYSNELTLTTASLGDIAGDMANESDQIQESQMSSASETGLNGENLNAGIFERTDKQPRIFTNGLGYKGRPIVWILNNTYGWITNLGVVSSFDDFRVFAPCIEEIPISIDEVKSVYISEDPKAFSPYLFCPSLTGRDAVTIFVYTHFKMQNNSKGLRKTHFQGYNVPSTFEMEDYSVLPPMEDFRRTIFWEPNIKTDANGNARVEFWNNSSCHEMHISAEGMTETGQFLINE